ncbi:MAG: NUDIX domain-containing protein [bacterium]|nr:NUDIX domain-containing protein [bacterium]
MTLQVGVKIFLRNKENKYLILKRSAKRYPGLKNLWDIPGGRINPGSSLLENLKREVREETGIELDSVPVLITAQDILRPDKHIVRLTYTGEGEGEPRLSDEEEDFRWLTLDEMMGFDGLDEYTREALAHVTCSL